MKKVISFFILIIILVPEDGSNPYNLYFIIQHATDKMFSPEEKEKIEKLENEFKKNDKRGRKKKNK